MIYHKITTRVLAASVVLVLAAACSGNGEQSSAGSSSEGESAPFVDPYRTLEATEGDFQLPSDTLPLEEGKKDEEKAKPKEEAKKPAAESVPRMSYDPSIRQYIDSTMIDSLGNLDTPEPREASTYVFRRGNVVPGKLIALTFDDGPNYKATTEVLAVLEKYNVPATFFVVGKLVGSAESQLRKAVAQGCEIASHTWDHSYLSILTPEQQAEEISKTSQAIHKAVGYYPNFMRPPYMDADKGVLDNIDLPAVSGVNSDDWVTSNAPSKITDIVLRNAKPNTIYVMHDLAANHRTPQALDSIIPCLLSQGYTFVTVTDMFTSAGVTPQPGRLYSTPHRHATPSAASTYRERSKKKNANAKK